MATQEGSISYQPIKNGRRTVVAYGPIGIEQLAQASMRVAQSDAEVEGVKFVLSSAARVIVGFRKNGGGITKSGDLLIPQHIREASPEGYVPKLSDLELSAALVSHLNRKHVVGNYRDTWMDQYGFDPKEYLPKRSKDIAILAKPNYNRREAYEQIRDGVGRSVDADGDWRFGIVYLDKAFRQMTQKLFIAKNLPQLVSAAGVVRAAHDIAEQNLFTDGSDLDFNFQSEYKLVSLFDRIPGNENLLAQSLGRRGIAAFNEFIDIYESAGEKRDLLETFAQEAAKKDLGGDNDALLAQQTQIIKEYITGTLARRKTSEA